MLICTYEILSIGSDFDEFITLLNCILLLGSIIILFVSQIISITFFAIISAFIRFTSMLSVPKGSSGPKISKIISVTMRLSGEFLLPK